MLTSENVKKYLPKSRAITIGHLDQKRKNTVCKTNLLNGDKVQSRPKADNQHNKSQSPPKANTKRNNFQSQWKAREDQDKFKTKCRHQRATVNQRHASNL
jgi:hypothetical protein